MDIQLEKLTLLNLLKETERLLVTTSVKNVFVKEKKDWFEELTENQKNSLEESLAEADRGEVHDYKAFIKTYL
jgi:hypothetical protein